MLLCPKSCLSNRQSGRMTWEKEQLAFPDKTLQTKETKLTVVAHEIWRRQFFNMLGEKSPRVSFQLTNLFPCCEECSEVLGDKYLSLFLLGGGGEFAAVHGKKPRMGAERALSWHFAITQCISKNVHVLCCARMSFRNFPLVSGCLA